MQATSWLSGTMNRRNYQILEARHPQKEYWVLRRAIFLWSGWSYLTKELMVCSSFKWEWQGGEYERIVRYFLFPKLDNYTLDVSTELGSTWICSSYALLFRSKARKSLDDMVGLVESALRLCDLPLFPQELHERSSSQQPFYYDQPDERKQSGFSRFYYWRSSSKGPEEHEILYETAVASKSSSFFKSIRVRRR